MTRPLDQIRESAIEAYLKKQVKRFGGDIRKCQWIGRRGAPDRAVFLNGVHLVELKRPGKKAEAHQAREHNRLLKHGVRVHVLDTFAAVDSFIGRVYGGPF